MESISDGLQIVAALLSAPPVKKWPPQIFAFTLASPIIKTLKIHIPWPSPSKIKMFSLDIQEEIIQRLPVRSLLQFRSVSKAWKALIDSPEFIAAHSVRRTQPQNLLIRYDDDMVEFENVYVSVVDDDTFPQQKFPPPVPLIIQQLYNSQIVGSSCGLLCVYGYYAHPDNPDGKDMAVLWNPSIKKWVAVDVPDVKHVSYETVLGFGVCPSTSDPNIVKITQHLNIGSDGKMKGQKHIPWKVEVYKLSSGEWRTPSCDLPRASLEVTWSQVVIDSFIYWLALDRVVIDGRFRISYTIMSFDMTSDEFREVCLLDSLAHPSGIESSVSKVHESLVVLKYSMDADKRICDVWIMGDGVPTLFTKLFTIKTPHASILTLGFRKGGEPILETPDDSESALVVYEPHSEHIDDLGISGTSRSFFVNSYMETLLLLNQ